MAAEALQNLCFDDVRGSRVLVALSGGADSVALLHLLCARREADDLTIFAAHYNHGIRGAHADADAAFCRQLCIQLGVEYFEGRGDIPRLAEEKRCGIESAAREARYAFLREVQEKTGSDMIALAHHLDDQAETILMHLFRGAGSEGAGGMARLKDGLYRPLLDVRKAQLVQYLESCGISWREDSTNALDDNPRNALRLNVLPEIEKCYPHAAEAIARYGHIVRSESNFIGRAAKAFLEKRLERGPYGVRILLDGNEDEALLRRAVRIAAGEDFSRDKTEEIIALAKKPRGKLEISGRLTAEKTPRALYFLRRKDKSTTEVPLRIPGETVLDGICRILAEEGDFPIQPENPNEEIFDADLVKGAVLRTRRDGDRIQPLGSGGSRLLSDYLTDKKIDRPIRECLPLLAHGNRILWAGGVGMAHEARITTDTRRRVRLSIHSITDEKPEVQQ